MELKIDRDRAESIEHGEFDWYGIPIRAQDKNGRWITCDVRHLDRDSFIALIRSRGEINPWIESMCLVLAGYENEGGE